MLRAQVSSLAHLNQTDGHKSLTLILAADETLSVLFKVIGIRSEVDRAELISKRLKYCSNRGWEVRAKTEHGPQVTPLTTEVV